MIANLTHPTFGEVAANLWYLLGVVLAYVCGWLKTQAPKQVNPIRDVDRDRKIDRLLTELGVECRSDRAYLSKFHNGAHYVDGSEILKITRTNEWAREGYSTEARDYDGILVSHLSDLMDFVSNGVPSVVKLNDLDPDSRFRRMMINGGTRKLIVCAIRPTGKIVGFVALDYADESDVLPNLNVVADYAARIGLVMEKYK